MRLPLASFLIALTTMPALAQVDLRTREAKAEPNTWNITVGAGVGAAPKYLGSKDMGVSFRPVFSVGRGVGNRYLSVADDNIGFGLVEGEQWRAGVTGKLLWERRESRDIKLRGMGNVPFGGEIGGFAEFYPLPWLRARGDLRHGISAHNAFVGEVKLDAFARIADRWTVSAGPRVAFAGRDFTQTYLGVNAVQSLRTGLPQFTAQSGVLSYGAATQLNYQWTPRIETSVFAQYNRLSGDAAESPLTKQRGSRDQFTVGSTLRWTIDTGR